LAKRRRGNNVLNFIFNLLYILGTAFLKHPFLYSALFLGVIFAIIVKKAAPSYTRKLTEAERQLIRETAKKRREQIQAITPREDLVCPNCGAILKAAYAECEYCGARTRMIDGSIPE
jgi:hypothetical protein